MSLVEKFGGGTKDGGDPPTVTYKKLVKPRVSSLKDRPSVGKDRSDLTSKRIELAIDDFRNSNINLCEKVMQSVFYKIVHPFSSLELLALVELSLCTFLDLKFDGSLSEDQQKVLDKKINVLLSKDIFDEFLVKLNSYESRLPEKMGVKKIIVKKDKVFTPEAEQKLSEITEASFADINLSSVTESDKTILDSDKKKKQASENKK